jgi:hypothetical protein
LSMRTKFVGKGERSHVSCFGRNSMPNC